MNPRPAFRIALTLAVVAFIAAMILAWMEAPGPMALVTATMLINYWLSEIRKGL